MQQRPIAQDGVDSNSPFTEALIRRIKEPGLEIGTMFRRVTSDVFERTHGRQRPEISISLLTGYFDKIGRCPAAKRASLIENLDARSDEVALAFRTASAAWRSGISL